MNKIFKFKLFLILFGVSWFISYSVLIEYLMGFPKAIKNIDEKVIIVGDNPALYKSFSNAGFTVQQMSAELEQKRYSIQTLLQMIIYDDKKKTIYSGDYSTKEIICKLNDYVDIKIIENSLRRIMNEILPIFGCINSLD